MTIIGVLCIVGTTVQGLIRQNWKCISQILYVY